MTREVKQIRPEVDERLHKFEEREKCGLDLFAPVREEALNASPLATIEEGDEEDSTPPANGRGASYASSPGRSQKSSEYGDVGIVRRRAGRALPSTSLSSTSLSLDDQVSVMI